MTSAPQVDKQDLATYAEAARTWLAVNGPEDHAVRDPHDVSIFHNLDTDTERAILGKLRAWQKAKFDAGYGAIAWPTELGGAGLPTSYADAFKSAEAAAVSLTRHELFSVTLNLVAPTVRLFGSQELKEEVFPGLHDGSQLACQLFSEPSAGSDLAAVRTRAVREGDSWIISGQKVWTSGAQFAEWGQALVRTDPSAAKHAGLTAFLVPMNSPGVEVRQIKQMSGGTSFNEVFLTEVRVPDSYRLGEPGEGWKVTRATLGFERANASNKKGVGGSFDQLVELAIRTGALGHRDIRTRLAELRAREIAAEVSLHREQRARDTGAPPGASGSMRKLQWVRKLNLVSELARDLLGSALIVDRGEPGTFSWNAHILGAPGYRIAGGSDQIQRNIVAERHLGLPAEPARPQESM
ncbi:acyl-CoA dehydrogenase family protein [Nocardioides sp. YIM 152315]|uniref:acyl-CoA dehydrogenase family protein n=1 Tax=Nocardioides sp. YIM 152315 TaxID=3031760 RepID=UPI0023DBB0CD|nr:acyl-CoA dehydrogenase family protein [Nocardioides sp. YIM 152315]MDF1602235.1 acyl-CoA dehydrogenase family protein [Nocardioides sp. YIM 152315]